MISYPAVYHPIDEKKNSKSVQKRDVKTQELLLGLVDLYIKTGKPIGSQTLKEQGFAHLSSATIRNYFAWLDQEGYLEQVHTSGGRIPTDLAWRRYFDLRSQTPIDSRTLASFEDLFLPSRPHSTEAIYDHLNHLCDQLARLSRCATFLVSPSFEQDHLSHVHIWDFQIDRWVITTRTQMGFFGHEVLQLKDVNPASVRASKIQQALSQKLYDPLALTSELSSDEARLLHEIYSELMVRQLVHHTHPQDRVWIKSGLANLMSHAELAQADKLASSLYFFDHRRSKEKLLQMMQNSCQTQCWIGKEMHKLLVPSEDCSLIAVPYYVHQQLAGTVGLIGPKRIPYTYLRQALEHTAKLISHYLTERYYAFKLPYYPANSAK